MLDFANVTNRNVVAEQLNSNVVLGDVLSTSSENQEVRANSDCRTRCRDQGKVTNRPEQTRFAEQWQTDGLGAALTDVNQQEVKN